MDDSNRIIINVNQLPKDDPGGDSKRNLYRFGVE
jgi:hypothetical protein